MKKFCCPKRLQLQDNGELEAKPVSTTLSLSLITWILQEKFLSNLAEKDKIKKKPLEIVAICGILNWVFIT